MNKEIVISMDEMKKLATYERSFKDYVDETSEEDPDIQFENLSFEGIYQITINDIRSALINARDSGSSFYDLIEFWCYPIFSSFREDFGLDMIRYDSELSGEGHISMKAPSIDDYLPVNETDFICHVSDALLELDYDDIRPCREYEEVESLIQEIDWYIEDREKPINEKRFSDELKLEYARYLNENVILKHATEDMKELARQYIEELVSKDNVEAMNIKGYAQYGGNDLYGCDWISSRDLISRLYEKTHEGVYANTLGYIYYYGRCTDGVPEYEKAFEMFTAGHACGLYESTYKLADMFRHGYACIKNPDISFKLYQSVYDDCMIDPGRSIRTNLADAALRLGNCYLNGIGVEEDVTTAFYYLLQADFAAQKRLQHSDFFGDSSVAIGVRKTLAETREKLPEGYFREYVEGYKLANMVNDLVTGKGMVYINKSKKGFTIRIIRMERSRKMITVPELEYVGLEREVVFTAKAVNVSKRYAYQRGIKFDRAYIYSNKMFFENHGRDVLTLNIRDGRFYAPKKDKNGEEMITLASVSFDGSGKTYDYICDISGIEPGNRVIVETSRGDTEVTVEGIRTIKKKDLPIPLEKYKKIKERSLTGE